MAHATADTLTRMALLQLCGDTRLSVNMSRVAWTLLQDVTQPGRAGPGRADAPFRDIVNDGLAASMSVMRFIEASQLLRRLKI